MEKHNKLINFLKENEDIKSNDVFFLYFYTVLKEKPETYQYIYYFKKEFGLSLKEVSLRILDLYKYNFEGTRREYNPLTFLWVLEKIYESHYRLSRKDVTKDNFLKDGINKNDERAQ